MSFSSARLCSIYNPKSIIPDTNFLGVHVPFSLDTQSFTTEHTIHRNAPSRPSRHHITFPFSPNRSAGWAGKNFTDNDKAEHTAAVPTAVASYFFTQVQNTRSFEFAPLASPVESSEIMATYSARPSNIVRHDGSLRQHRHLPESLRYQDHIQSTHTPYAAASPT